MSTNSSMLVEAIKGKLEHTWDVESVKSETANRVSVMYDGKRYEVTVTKMCANCGEEMDFGQALRCMKAGCRVARSGWIDRGQWLSIPLVDGPKEIPAKGIWGKANEDFAEGNGGSVRVLPYVTMKTETGCIVMGWRPTSEDMLSEDWVVV